ncbi:DUF4190 domain-containing protein [Kocuria dechangensis]|nr:DUF4190 domain-containing protein [Kocuria dechangensis]
MSQNDNTSEPSGTGAGGSSSYGGDDVPEYGQRVEGAPSGPSYEPPRYGQGSAGDQYASPQYGQGQYGQGQQGSYPPPSYDQGQYGQGQYGQGQYGQGQYGQGQYGQGQYGQDQYPQGQYGQGQYAQQGYPGQYQGQYDMGQYGGAPKPAGTGLGIAALVLGILSLLTSWLLGFGLIPGLVGLVLGIVALRKLGRVPGASKAMPVVGIVLSVLGILASVLMFVLVASFMGPLMDAINGPCSQYLNDQAALEQCLTDELGMDTIPQ